MPLTTTLVVVTLLGAALAALGWWLRSANWWESYLIAWLYWISFPLGAISLLLLHMLTGGAWGDALRPACRAALATLPLMAVLFVPLALNLEALYPWADPEKVAHSELLQHKQPYLNETAFIARTVGYFVVWLALWALVAWQSRHPLPPSSPAARRVRKLAGIGLGLHALAVTFSAIDWGMSLEPQWYSAIYGLLFLISQALAALAGGIAVSVLAPQVGTRYGTRSVATTMPAPDVLHDLGKLLLAFVMIWAYFQYSQFLIIWYGNLPEEVPWYLKRIEHGWLPVALAMGGLQFALPFFLLLSRDLKRHGKLLAWVALGVVFSRWLEVWWLVAPADGQPIRVPWLELTLTAAIGGLWLLAFFFRFPTLQREASALSQPRIRVT